MAFIYSNHATQEKIESNKNQTCEEILELLRTLTTPENLLIITLPSQLGLDFHAEENSTLWVEFYDDEISSAYVTMDVAEQIVKRAFEGGRGKIKERYSDLIPEWLY